MINIECLVCGKDFQRLNKVEIEGTVLEVCDKCVVFGKRVFEKEYKPIMKPIEFKEFVANDFELVYNYGRMIRSYREQRGLTREEFAKRINERGSVIKRLEEEKIEPSEDLMKKVERFLGIKLLTKYEGKVERRGEKKKLDLTMGDVVKVK